LVRGGKWSEEETAEFYKALRMVNTDFRVIGGLLNRDRKSVKLKFKKEEKINLEKVNEALNRENKLPYPKDKLNRIREVDKVRNGQSKKKGDRREYGEQQSLEQDADDIENDAHLSEGALVDTEVAQDYLTALDNQEIDESELV